MQKNKENICRHSGLSFLDNLLTIFQLQNFTAVS